MLSHKDGNENFQLTNTDCLEGIPEDHPDYIEFSSYKFIKTTVTIPDSKFVEALNSKSSDFYYNFIQQQAQILNTHLISRPNNIGRNHVLVDVVKNNLAEAIFDVRSNSDDNIVYDVYLKVKEAEFMNAFPDKQESFDSLKEFVRTAIPNTSGQVEEIANPLNGGLVMKFAPLLALFLLAFY